MDSRVEVNSRVDSKMVSRIMFDNRMVDSSR